MLSLTQSIGIFCVQTVHRRSSQFFTFPLCAWYGCVYMQKCISLHINGSYVLACVHFSRYSVQELALVHIIPQKGDRSTFIFRWPHGISRLPRSKMPSDHFCFYPSTLRPQGYCPQSVCPSVTPCSPTTIYFRKLRLSCHGFEDRCLGGDYF